MISGPNNELIHLNKQSLVLNVDVKAPVNESGDLRFCQICLKLKIFLKPFHRRALLCPRPKPQPLGLSIRANAPKILNHLQGHGLCQTGEVQQMDKGRSKKHNNDCISLSFLEFSISPTKYQNGHICNLSLQ